MEKLYLFAIGGTGARVVRSLTMMLAAGIKGHYNAQNNSYVDGLYSSCHIVPLIIDYDLSNGDKRRAVDALKTYSCINQALYDAGNNYNDHFFMTRISPLLSPEPNKAPSFEFHFGPQKTEKFSQYLSKNALNTQPDARLTEDLLEALYDTSDQTSKDAELELDMVKGFKGNPNIGAVVFHELKNSPEYQKFVTDFNPDYDRVFIISSIFGGTGASGFPELVKAIRNDTNHANVQHANIGAALILPYFKLNPFNADNGDTGAIDATLFNSKTRAALSYYATNNGINQRVDNIYYIGDPHQDAINYAEGEERQKNKAHVVEFIAASAVIDFMTKNRGQGAYEFAVKDAKVETKLQLPDFYNNTHELVLEDLTTFALAMKYYRDVICGDRKKIDSANAFYNTFNLSKKLGHDVWKSIDEFLDADKSNDWGFYVWLEELCDKERNHKIQLYQMDKSKDLTEFMSHVKIKKKWWQFWKHNPLSDDEISSKINELSRKETTPIDWRLLKFMRDVSRDTYKNL